MGHIPHHINPLGVSNNITSFYEAVSYWYTTTTILAKYILLEVYAMIIDTQTSVYSPLQGTDPEVVIFPSAVARLDSHMHTDGAEVIVLRLLDGHCTH